MLLYYNILLREFLPIYHNSIYVDFIDIHPGGDSILANVGGDSSEGFHGEQHPVNVWDVIPKYYIGNLIE